MTDMSDEKDFKENGLEEISLIIGDGAGTMKGKEGGVILGKKDDSEPHYVTHYEINREGQWRTFHSDPYYRSDLCPCCKPPYTANRFVWNLVSSTMFITFLRVAVITIGVCKELLNLRTINKDLHFIHSVVESAFALSLVAIQAGKAWDKYCPIRDQHRLYEVNATSPLKDGFRREIIAFIYFSIFFGVHIVAFFFIFYFVPGLHLGWTALTNTSVMILVSMASSTIIKRCKRMSHLVADDERKAVIYDSLLLLAACVDIIDSPSNKERNKESKLVLDKVLSFSSAVESTAMLKRPSYITCPQKLEPKSNSPKHI